VRFQGLFDLQVNGFGGVDFNGPGLSIGRVEHALERMRETGVTRCLPTLITSSFEDFAERARVISRLPHPAIAGIHMEGPYLSPEDGPRGAHPREHVRPASAEDFNRRQDAADGRITLVTLAPEVPGALALIEHLRRTGVQVAIGHTAADPATIADAVSAGAGLATHLGNGCAAVLPRHPNVIWELLAADEVLASIIVDGHHLPPTTVKSLVRAKSPTRTVLITDAIAAAGSPPGRYTLGGIEVERGSDGRVSLPGTPYLAGSSLTMDHAIGNTVRCTGLPIDQVLPMASTIPAAWLGVPTRGTVTADWDPVACRLTVTSVTDVTVDQGPLVQGPTRSPIANSQ
jgi:N-acetylglucosamine-6-phosphate deacetylase